MSKPKSDKNIPKAGYTKVTGWKIEMPLNVYNENIRKAKQQTAHSLLSADKTLAKKPFTEKSGEKTIKEIINLVYYDCDLTDVPVKLQFDFKILEEKYVPIKNVEATRQQTAQEILTIINTLKNGINLSVFTRESIHIPEDEYCYCAYCILNGAEVEIKKKYLGKSEGK